MLIIDKPAGIPVHAGPSGGRSLEDYFDALRFGLPRAPALAHRLDRDTSGCLVLGRHPKALRRLGRLFSESRVEKIYWALTVTAPARLSGSIDTPLIKHNSKGGWRMAATTPDTQGRLSAVTTYRTLARSDHAALVECRPKTGRTHQIRVHLQSIGAPIIGDKLYGGETRDSDQMLLHARRISVPLKANGPAVKASAPPPPAMATALSRLFPEFDLEADQKTETGV